MKILKLNILFTLFAITLAGCSTSVKMAEIPFQEEKTSPFTEREDANGIFLNQAWLARTEGRLDDADILLNRAMRINPINPEIYYHMALLRQQQGQIEQARQLAGRAISLGPESGLERQLKQFLKSLIES